MKKLVCMFLAFLIVVGLVPSVDASGHGELSGLNNLTSECGIVGNIVKFGKYEQNNVTSDSEEPIEWIVVATEANKSLLLSKYALDYKIYDSYRKTSWEKSSLRWWLNSVFLDEAFEEEERELIVPTTIKK